MNRDQLKSLLGEGASKEVIDAIMRANGEDVNAAKAPIDALKAQLEEANGKISSLEDEANKNLTADEQWQKQLDAANATAKQALRDLNEATAAAVFAGAGMSEDEYKPFIGSVIGGTRDETTAAAKAIADVVSAKAKAAADDAAAGRRRGQRRDYDQEAVQGYERHRADRLEAEEPRRMEETLLERH